MFLSIITVCYNSAGTIRQTFESVLQQDFNDYEYIVVDGVSTDGTLGIIQEYLPKFNGKMRYVSEKDNGIYDAMNKGIRVAQGEVIGLVNSDDYYEKDAFKNIYEAVQNTPDADVYYGLLRNVAENGEEIDIHRIHHSRLKNCSLPHPATFIKNKCYVQYGLYDLTYKVAADYELMLRIFLKGGKYCPVNHILSNFRCGGVSSDGRNITEHLQVQYQYNLISKKRKILSGFLFKIKLFAGRLFNSHLKLQ